MIRRIAICLLGLSAVTASAERVKVEALYARHCAACHGAEYEGGVGGSLVDGEWKHGSSDEDVYRSIAKGNVEMQMQAWEEVLSAGQIRSLVILLREKEHQFREKQQKPPVPAAGEVTKTRLHDYRIETVVADGLKTPWAIAFLPDGRRLVTEKHGALRIIAADGTLGPKPVEGTPEVTDHGQGGLMEVAIHPQFASNGWVYLGFADGAKETGPNGKEQTRSITAVARGRIRDHRWTDHEWIYRPDPKFRSRSGVHFGTRFVFRDGLLFFVIGERGGMMESQDLSRPNGKIFRLHDDGRVPADNPFADRPDAIAGIWSYGHRNPQGLAIDPRDGSIWSTEHGPRGGDELNRIRAGANYGWPVVTHGMNYDGSPMTAETTRAGIEEAAAVWVPSLAVCGLDFLEGDAFPNWKHDLFSGGLVTEEVRRIRITDGKVVDQEVILKGIGRVRDVACAPDGTIHVLLNRPDRVVRLLPAR